jgi:arginase
MTKFVVVPQWQGSGSSRAMQLIDGAEAIRGDRPTAATTLVHVPTEAGEALDTDIRRASSLVTTAELQRQALVGIDEPVITIGGDCGVELASVGEALRRDPGIAVVWFDAHGDLNTPLSSPSGSFSGMVARALTGEGAAMLLPEAPLDPARLVLVGVRDLDDGELAHIEERGIPMVSSVMTSAASSSDAANGMSRPAFASRPMFSMIPRIQSWSSAVTAASSASRNGVAIERTRRRDRRIRWHSGESSIDGSAGSMSRSR